MKQYEDILKKSLTQIESWVADGSTIKDIAEKLDIPYSTFRRYSKENSELKSAIAQGKCKKNDNVVAALYKCCVGYKYYEDVAVKVKEEILADDGKTILVKEHVEVKSVRKYKGPDINAIKHWTTNREPDKWKNDPSKDRNDKKALKLKEKEINSKTIQL